LLLFPFVMLTIFTSTTATTTATTTIGIFRAIEYSNFQPFLVFGHASPFFSVYTYVSLPPLTSHPFIYFLIVHSFIHSSFSFL
jgi:hypothetical protein